MPVPLCDCMNVVTLSIYIDTRICSFVVFRILCTNSLSLKCNLISIHISICIDQIINLCKINAIWNRWQPPKFENASDLSFYCHGSVVYSFKVIHNNEANKFACHSLTEWVVRLAFATISTSTSVILPFSMFVNRWSWWWYSQCIFEIEFTIYGWEKWCRWMYVHVQRTYKQKLQ